MIIINFAGPFTVNLLREMIMIIFLIPSGLVLILPVGAMAFFSAAYNLNLYARVSQGVSFNCLGFAGVSLREAGVLLSHIWPVGFALSVVSFWTVKWSSF